MNKTCKNCSKELESDYKICPYCGVKIENEIQTEKPEKREENMRICQYCGKSINADFKICPYCGEKVEEEILEIYCPSCGKSIKSDFKVCPYWRK